MSIISIIVYLAYLVSVCVISVICVPVCVQSNTTVSHLQLAGNNIGCLGAVYIKTVLIVNQNITFLVLDYCNSADIHCSRFISTLCLKKVPPFTCL